MYVCVYAYMQSIYTMCVYVQVCNVIICNVLLSCAVTCFNDYSKIITFCMLVFLAELYCIC